MLETVRSYLHQHKLGIVYSFITAFGICLLFGLYLFLIGIPKTQARNLFNAGQFAELQNDKAQAVNYYLQALRIWPEQYIREQLKQFEN